MSSAEIYQFPGFEKRETFADYWEYCQEVGAFQSKSEAHIRFHMSPEQYFKDCGWIYVLANPLMSEGVYKVGRTTGRIERRMRQLYTTGVPVEFECLYAHWFADCITAERHVHSVLASHRLSDSREFFEADLKRIEHAIMEVAAIGEMHPDHMIDLACARHNYAVKNERVRGQLVVPERTPTPADLKEIPF